MTAKQMAEASKKELATAAMYEADVDDGFQGSDTDSYAIPMINILQSLSPQVDESDGEYIEGAKPGMMYNNVTNALYGNDAGLVVVPCAFKRSFVEWVPREIGGGFVKEHSAEEAAQLRTVRNDRNQDIMENGNILADTRTHYVLVLNRDAWEPAVIAMGSTQLKNSRRWMSRMKNLKMRRADGGLFTPPMYAHRWKLTTVKEENDKGKWYGWKLDLDGDDTSSLVIDPELYQAAKEFKTLVAAGTVQVKQTEARVPHPEDDDIPY